MAILDRSVLNRNPQPCTNQARSTMKNNTAMSVCHCRVRAFFPCFLSVFKNIADPSVHPIPHPRRKGGELYGHLLRERQRSPCAWESLPTFLVGIVERSISQTHPKSPGKDVPPLSLRSWICHFSQLRSKRCNAVETAVCMSCVAIKVEVKQ